MNLEDRDPDDNPIVVAEGQEADRVIRKLSRRSFVWAGLAVAATYGGFKILASRREDAGIAWPFRRQMDNNASLLEDYFSPKSFAKEYDASEAKQLPIDNGDEGLSDDFDPDAWTLKLVGTGEDPAPKITLKEIQKLPKVEMTTELRCIEGWSVIVHWTGCKFADFVKKYPPAPKNDTRPSPDNLASLPDYVSIETPDGGYYVGLDMASAVHPQTLLCWAMNGEDLALEHGAPLRLVIPSKYGIKNIKRIGTITYTDDKPRDYWAEQGYDWYAGL